MAVTVSLINMKGGVGKTTIATQLSHAASGRLNVLAVDLDPQSNLSQSVMGPRDYVKHLEDNRPTIAQVFDEYSIEIAGLVFNHSSSYSNGPEGLRSIEEVREQAKQYGWHIFSNRVKYSATYPKAAREGTPLNLTSYARWDVIDGFSSLRDEIFTRLGVERRSK